MANNNPQKKYILEIRGLGILKLYKLFIISKFIKLIFNCLKYIKNSGNKKTENANNIEK